MDEDYCPTCGRQLPRQAPIPVTRWEKFWFPTRSWLLIIVCLVAFFYVISMVYDVLTVYAEHHGYLDEWLAGGKPERY